MDPSHILYPLAARWRLNLEGWYRASSSLCAQAFELILSVQAFPRFHVNRSLSAYCGTVSAACDPLETIWCLIALWAFTIIWHSSICNWQCGFRQIAIFASRTESTIVKQCQWSGVPITQLFDIRIFLSMLSIIFILLRASASIIGRSVFCSRIKTIDRPSAEPHN